MCQLPRTQPDSVALAENMLSGFQKYPETFVSADTASLRDALDNFNQARNSFNSIASLYKQAGKQQKQAFEALKKAIAVQVKSAEVDTAENPEKLGLIGFGPRREKSPVDLPASPGNLKVVAIENSTIFLKWKKSSIRYGGPVRMYLIERCLADADGGYLEWQLAATSYNNEVKLKHQPQGVKLAYQVRASNISGVTYPTNMVSVIL